MRKAGLTGLLIFGLIFSGASQKTQAATMEHHSTFKEPTVVALLSTEKGTALSVLSAIAVEEEWRAEIPVIKHIVMKNESLIAIAKIYNTTWSRIYDKNTDLVDPNVVLVGLELVIPAVDEQIGPRELPTLAAPPTGRAQRATTARGNSSGNGYVAGYCTWYVKNRRPDLPNNLGNARSWVSNASKQGLPAGSTPIAGAVGQRNNHVVYVESVNGDGTITISDMNYQALFEITTRTVNAADFRYIY